MGRESMQELRRRLAEAKREIDGLKAVVSSYGRAWSGEPLRVVKELLDKLTEAYPPPAGTTHCLGIGRDGRLQLSVWDGDELVPLSFDDRDGDFHKGAEQLLEDVRRMVGIYWQARELMEKPLRDKLKEPCDEFQRQLVDEEVGLRLAEQHLELKTALRESRAGRLREAQERLDDAARTRKCEGCGEVLPWHRQSCPLVVPDAGERALDEGLSLEQVLSLVPPTFAMQVSERWAKGCNVRTWDADPPSVIGPTSPAKAIRLAVLDYLKAAGIDVPPAERPPQQALARDRVLDGPVLRVVRAAGVVLDEVWAMRRFAELDPAEQELWEAVTEHRGADFGTKGVAI